MAEIYKIEAHPNIHSGLFRLILCAQSEWRLFMNRKNIQFRLQYKKENESSWNTISFDHSYLQWRPTLYVSIKIPTDLFDYNMQFRLSFKLLQGYSSFVINVPIQCKMT